MNKESSLEELIRYKNKFDKQKCFWYYINAKQEEVFHFSPNEH